MKEVLKLLIQLQDIDSRILQKRLFIDKVPERIFEVDGPLKLATSALEKTRQKGEALTKKKKEKEAMLDEISDKIQKMKTRVTEIKTNKEYQAHLKEIESQEKKISDIEEEILLLMEEIDNMAGEQKTTEEEVRIEQEKISAIKKDLAREVELYEKELSLLKEERAREVERLEPDEYNAYMTLLNSGKGIAVTRAKNEICLGCNMNIPPQLFVEIKKNEEIIHCPQCHRILYYDEGA